MSHPNHCGALAALVLMFILSPRAEGERIRTSVSGLNLNYLSIFSADAKGFFKDEGLENETIVIGGPAGIAALISGDVDYSGAGQPIFALSIMTRPGRPVASRSTHCPMIRSDWSVSSIRTR